MATLAFVCEVLQFTVQCEALRGFSCSAEIRTKGVVPFYERSVVQAGGIHTSTLRPRHSAAVDGRCLIAYELDERLEGESHAALVSALRTELSRRTNAAWLVPKRPLRRPS